MKMCLSCMNLSVGYIIIAIEREYDGLCIAHVSS